MKIQVIRKKASSLRELGHEEVEIGEVSTLRELLTAVARVEFEKQHGTADFEGANRNEQGASPVRMPRMLHESEEELRQQGRLGKIQFGELYNDQSGDWEKALATLFQDFEDGLYRVYIDGVEYTELSQMLAMKENAQVVFLRLVMLSGRLW